MKKNVGTIDRTVRILIAIAIALLAYVQLINGMLAIILLVLAAIFVITSFLGFCPIYYGLGISSLIKKK